MSSEVSFQYFLVMVRPRREGLQNDEVFCNGERGDDTVGVKGFKEPQAIGRYLKLGLRCNSIGPERPSRKPVR